MRMDKWIANVMSSDLCPEAKAVVYELIPYLRAFPSLRRLIINGGENVHRVDP